MQKIKFLWMSNILNMSDRGMENFWKVFFFMQEVRLFGKICNGTIDSTMFRYVLTYNDIINIRLWSTEEVDELFKTIYPFATVIVLWFLKRISGTVSIIVHLISSLYLTKNTPNRMKKLIHLEPFWTQRNALFEKKEI